MAARTEHQQGVLTVHYTPSECNHGNTCVIWHYGLSVFSLWHRNGFSSWNSVVTGDGYIGVLQIHAEWRSAASSATCIHVYAYVSVYKMLHISWNIRWQYLFLQQQIDKIYLSWEEIWIWSKVRKDAHRSSKHAVSIKTCNTVMYLSCLFMAGFFVKSGRRWGRDAQLLLPNWLPNSLQ